MPPLDPILLVEDEPDAVTLLRHAFTRAGIHHPVHAVCDGDQAIAYLDGSGAFADRAAYPLPGVVLLDLKLPRCSGLEVIAWIRGDSRIGTLPVVVLTSSRERRDVRRAYAAGANSYLVKPSSLSRLVQLATAFRVYWLELNERPRLGAASPDSLAEADQAHR